MTDPRTEEQEQLAHEIEGTREALGDTVDALAAKADVKAQVSGKIEEQKAAWRERQEKVKTRAEERPWVAVAVALGFGLLIGRAFGRR